MAVDLNEAPEGYVAVSGDCTGCSFRATLLCPVNDKGEWVCLGENREDGNDVYFIKEDTYNDHIATVAAQPVPPDRGIIPTIPSNISLRDFFAGCAITGLLAADYHAVNAVVHAYEAADEMLRVREKSLKEGEEEK